MAQEGAVAVKDAVGIYGMVAVLSGIVRQWEWPSEGSDSRVNLSWFGSPSGCQKRWIIDVWGSDVDNGAGV